MNKLKTVLMLAIIVASTSSLQAMFQPAAATARAAFARIGSAATRGGNATRTWYTIHPKKALAGSFIAGLTTNIMIEEAQHVLLSKQYRYTIK
jgi:hypothetical protein